MSPSGDARPTGRQEIRAAVLEAAARHFAAHGSRASLRGIAAEARVNLGLVHRHFGSKDDLLRAVLRAQTDTGLELVHGAGSAGAAMRRLFRQATRSGRFVRIVAAHLLDGEEKSVPEDGAPVITALRSLPFEGPDEDRDLSLAAGLAMIYGWTVFGRRLADGFGWDEQQRARLEERLSAVVERVASGHATAGD